MRAVMAVGLAAGLGVLALAGCQRQEAEKAQAPASAAAAVEAPPPRNPGLWVQTVDTAGMTQKAEICLDAATDLKIARFGAQAAGGRCAGNRVTRTPQGWAFESVCDLGTGGQVTTRGVATGDMASRYVLKAETTTTGAAAPQMNGTRPLTLEAAWQGPCPAGMAPGDMRLPGGVSINLLELAP